MSYYKKLEQHARKLSRLDHLSAICGLDQAAMMPRAVLKHVQKLWQN